MNQKTWVKFSLIYTWVWKLREKYWEGQPWIFIGGTDAEVEAPILGLLMQRLFGKDPDAGKDWRQKGKRVAEDEMGRQH